MKLIQQYSAAQWTENFDHDYLKPYAPELGEAPGGKWIVAAEKEGWPVTVEAAKLGSVEGSTSMSAGLGPDDYKRGSNTRRVFCYPGERAAKRRRTTDPSPSKTSTASATRLISLTPIGVNI